MALGRSGADEEGAEQQEERCSEGTGDRSQEEYHAVVRVEHSIRRERRVRGDIERRKMK